MRIASSILVFFTISTVNVEAAIWYVRASALGVQTGDSWTDAFTDLHDALDAAQDGDEIWIAAGTYKPDLGSGDRTLAFQLPCGVSIYGGFAGWEQCIDERDVDANETILSGDLNEDDGPHDCETVSNCCQEHSDLGCDDAACEANVCAIAPACCNYPSPEPKESWDADCTILSKRFCCHLGSWRACENSYTVTSIVGCDFLTTLDGVTISGAFHDQFDNTPNTGSGFGVYCDRAALDLTRCSFRRNFLLGLYARSTKSITLKDCSFYDTTPGLSVKTQDSHLVASGCRFFEGAAGLSENDGSASLRNCSFEGSGANLEGESYVEKCLFQRGGGLNLFFARSTVTNSKFIGNKKHLAVLASAATVDNCIFNGNTSSTSGVGGGSATGLFRNCIFLNSHPLNSAIRWEFGNLYVLNCTIVGNGLENDRGGAGIKLDRANAQVLNSIIWGNGSGTKGTPEEDQIDLGTNPVSSFEIDYSIVEGWSGRFGGDGNFDADPMLVDLDGLDGLPGTADDDARLLPNSPAIGAGLSTSRYLLPSDLDGHGRILCGQVDMGAYEFGIGDFNCDYRMNFLDVVEFPGCMTGPSTASNFPTDSCKAFDYDADNSVDLCDFAALSNTFKRLEFPAGGLRPRAIP